MSAKDTSGPAFPTPICEEPFCRVCESKSEGTGVFYGGTQGMTLRDYFAAKAIQGYLASFDPHGEPVEFATKIAEDAYAMADAMLKAREAK